jgi:hypothetical protein
MNISDEAIKWDWKLMISSSLANRDTNFYFIIWIRLFQINVIQQFQFINGLF